MNAITKLNNRIKAMHTDQIKSGMVILQFKSDEYSNEVFNALINELDNRMESAAFVEFVNRFI